MSETLPVGRRRRWKRVAAVLVAVLLLYLLVAYVVLPLGWLAYAKRHPELDSVPTITRTADDIPGDPLNVALVGAEIDLKKRMIQAGWYPADPLTLKSCLEIAEATVLKRPYDDAPVSNLYLFGRKEDLAFEQPVGNNPRQRHHVRFWRSNAAAADGRPIWVGSATFDERVGRSHTTGQITHHIAADIDTERNHVLASLAQNGGLSEQSTIAGFQQQRAGKNGGGDPWHTDGDLHLGVLAVAP